MTHCLLRGKRFYCREWAFSKVNHCLENRPTSKTCGALIMGGPGCGKTALCCELVWPTVEGKQMSLNKRMLAYHFCQAHDLQTLSMTYFIRNLVKQIMCSEMVPGYMEKVKDPKVYKLLHSHECEMNPDEVFKKVFFELLSELEPPEKPLFILIDSIDESYLHLTSYDKEEGSKTIAELLANHHHLFPKWLLLACSSRKQSKSITRMFTGFRKVSLDDLRKSHVVRDVQQYILCRLDQEEELRQHLSRETAEMLNQLHIKSNGCFLYLEKVLNGVAENFIMLREIREIPGTLNGLYLWLCQRLFVRKQFSKIQPILNAILASRRPLSSQELLSSAQIKNTSLTEEEFEKRMKLLSKILITSPDGTKILFHHSFAEWLLDVKHCTQKYLCNASEGHSMLSVYASLHASELTLADVQDFSLHLVRSNFQPPIQYHHLVQCLILSGADLDRCLTAGIPKDPKVLKLLLDAGAEMPSDQDMDSASMKESLTLESPSVEATKLVNEIDSQIDHVDTNGRTLLHTAAYQGNLQIVDLLLGKGTNIEAVDKSSQTPLNLAARQGHAEVVSTLLNTGANVDHADEEGWTALRSSAWGGHTSVVSVLLAASASVNIADTDKRTALRAAAWGGHEDIVMKLLESDADVNIADNEGRTALIAAAYMGHTEIVEHLLDYNASIDHEDCDGRTALSVAALCIPASEGHEKVVSLLLERGAAVNHQDKDGMTPLLVAAYEGHSDVCEMLLEWDADVDHADKNGRTALLASASMGHGKVVSQLLFWGAAVDTIDSEGRTVLSIAAAQGSVGIVQQLLDRGLDEMHRDNAGMTPLHMAAYEGHTEVTEILIEHLAKVNEIDNDGRIPLNLAAQEGHLPVVQLLVEHGSAVDHRSHDGKTALRIAAIEGHKEVVQYMISVGASVSYKDADGRSTIYVLALENKFEMIQMLLEQNADVESADLEGRSALHVAAWQGHYKVIEVLVRYKAVVDAVDNDRRTALQSASWQGHDRVMQYLIEKGAKVDHMCNQGATALCIASQEGHENVGRVLLHFGANPNHADQFGRTPMKVAMKSGHVNVCKLLEQNGAVVPSGSKSRTSSSTSSSASNDTKPSSHIHTNTPVSANATISCVASISSAAPAVLNGTHLHSSPSESPDSTFDRRKSVLSNNSSKSSSNLTNSTNQSSLSSAFSSGTQPRPTESECLTFTQQLQQCSMTRNRARPVSRILSPVSEPVSPVQSPLGSPLEVTGDTFPGTNSSRFSPASARNLKLCNPSPAKLANFKPDKTSATVNITMNPNADINEEAVWQMNPFHANNLKSSLVMIENRRKTPDQPSKTIMGQSALEMSKSPEMRRKRNGIVTNPNLHKSKGINSVSHLNKLSKIENCDNRTPISNGNGALPNGHVSAMGNGKTGNGPVRPNGLPLKKETPL